jgi:CHAT domain-containing protein
MVWKRTLALFIISLAICNFAFTQNNTLSLKLQTAKKSDDLSTWIYEQLDSKTALKDIQEIYKNAWRKPKNADEHYAWLNLLNVIGYTQLLNGNILGSINDYENAFSYYKTHQIVSYDIVEYNLKPLANNYTRLGDYERAIFLQQTAIDILSKSGATTNQIVSLYSNKAISYRAMNDLGLAEKTIMRALALKPTAIAAIIANNVLADILYDAERYDEAEKVIHQNIEKQKANHAESAYWLMSSYATAGNVALAKNRANIAQSFFKKAIHLIDKYYPKSRTRERANLYTQVGKSYQKQQQFSIALGYFNKTLKTLGIADENHKINPKKIYGDNKLVDVFVQLSNVSEQQKNNSLAIQYLNHALRSTDLLRAEFAADKTKERLQKTSKEIIENAIQINYQLFQTTGNQKYLTAILQLTERSKARTLAEQIERNKAALLKSNKKDSLFTKKNGLERAILYEERLSIEDPKNASAQALASLKFDLALVDKAIAQKYPHQSATLAHTPINLKNLPKHQFIVYFFGEKDVYGIVIKQQAIDRIVKFPNAQKLKSQLELYVNTYFQKGPSAMLNNPKAFYESAYQVFSRFIAPLKMDTNTQLTIVPDGLLGYLSFDGLVTSPKYTENVSKWPFLIKNNSINYAFSLKTIHASKPANRTENFGGLFISHNDSKNAKLTAVNNEAENIQKFVKGDFFLGDAAKASTFERLFARTSVLHIGTHAYLSGANAEPTLDFGKEKVYLFELAAKPASPTLVLLSACRTADGELANGEGIISLARGFKAVGTSATIASLWNVNDATAATIASNFYQYLNQGTASEALRKAKLDWLNSPTNNSAMLLPYYWDSLVYMGNDQTIKLPKPTNWKMWGIIFAVGSLLLWLATFIQKK